MDEQPKDEFKGLASLEDQLRDLLIGLGADPGGRPGLEQLKREVRSYGMRRADAVGGRDNLIYRMGYALDAIGALSLNSDAYAGVLSSADLVRDIVNSYGEEPLEVPLHLLVGIALTRPEVDEWARSEARWHQWERLRTLSEAETAAFKASAAGQVPHASWRDRKPTKSQLYRIGEIVRLSGVPDPGCTTRGSASNFIDQADGNPRFWNAPSRGVRPSIK